MKLGKIILSLALSLAAVGAQAQTTTYQWFDSGGVSGSGSGFLTVNSTADSGNSPNYVYNLDSFTGTFGGSPITSLSSGDIVFSSPTAPTAPPSTALTDYSAWNIVFSTSTGGPFTLQQGSDILSIYTPAPEPASLALAGIGCLGLAALHRRK